MIDKESWHDWLSPLVMEYYQSLFIEFFSSLTLPLSHPLINHLSSLQLPILPSLTTSPQLIETGLTYNYRLTSCHWFGNYTHFDIGNLTCRNSNLLFILEDIPLLSSLASFSPWSYICIGLVCGKISPIYIHASKQLLYWNKIQKQFSNSSHKVPSVQEMIKALDDLRS